MAVTGNGSQQLNDHWRQLELIPPSQVLLTLKVYLDGCRGSAQVGILVTSEPSETWMSSEHEHVRSLDRVLSVAVAELEATLTYELERLGSF